MPTRVGVGNGPGNVSIVPTLPADYKQRSSRGGFSLAQSKCSGRDEEPPDVYPAFQVSDTNLCDPLTCWC